MFERTKKHLKDNKKSYIIGGSCLVTGGVVGAALASNVQVVQIVDAIKIQLWSPTTNVVIAALGDPGNVVKDMDTGTIWASQGQAARDLGVSAALMSRHLAGELAHVAGHHLKVMGKAGQPIDIA